jgi:hypothetical protein
LFNNLKLINSFSELRDEADASADEEAEEEEEEEMPTIQVTGELFIKNVFLNN